MPTHDPLTAQDHALLQRPSVEGSAEELRNQGHVQERLNFLMALGYFTVEQTHVSADPQRIRWRFTRTSKPG